MLVVSKHLQWNFKFHAARKKEVEEAVRAGVLSQDEAKALLSRENFRPFLDDIERQCFVCRNKLKIPAVMWHGADAANRENLDLWFHPECVEGFAQRLMRDANEAKYGKEKADAILQTWKDDSAA